jgi:hypothetical protein
MCPGGLAWRWGRRVGCCRWDEVRGYKASEVTVVVRGNTWGYLHYIYEFAAGGEPFEVRSSWYGEAEVRQFGDHVGSKSAEALLPLYSAALARGEALTFGRLGLGPDGVALDGKVTPWERLAEVRSSGKEGVSAHDRAGNVVWEKVSLKDVPDATVFLALANARLKRTI